MKKQVANMANEYYSGVIGYQKFYDSIPVETWNDEEISELLDLIIHELHVGWLLGVSKIQGENNRAEILALIHKIQQ